MEYFIYRPFYMGVDRIEISEAKYIELRKSRKILSNSLAIEEIYEIVVSNYLEFEQEILKLTTSHMIRKELIYPSIFNIRVELNKRLVNILTAIRSYIDSVTHNVSDCFEDKEDSLAKVKKIFSIEYDRNNYYQFMEAFRNYVQHRGLAIDLIRHNSHWTSHDEDGLLEYSLDISADKSRLMSDEKMKKKAMNEMGDKIDLKMAVRHYIESISYVHDSIRNLIASPVEIARKEIEEEINLFKNKFGNKSTVIRVCKMDGKKQIEVFPLFLEWDDVRQSLQIRNKKFVNLSKRYVTGKSKNEK